MKQTTDIHLDIGRGESLVLPAKKTGEKPGMKISHVFSSPDVHPYDQQPWEKRDIVIMDFKKGKPSFSRSGVEVPKKWTENAVKITASKYLFGGDDPNAPEFEDSLRHPFDRIANTYTVWGWQNGYFDTLEDAKAYNWELKAMLLNQIWAPNSPVWFNLGHWEQWRWGRPDLRPIYEGRGNKSFKAFHNEDGTLGLQELNNNMERPQTSACFLTEVDDSMESILHHQIAEGRIFASGSGVGINLSTMRSSYEPISGRGRSSGPISFNKGWDRMAGAIKSGGRSRRAARMVLMDSSHPNVREFLNLKNNQEHIAKIILREHEALVTLKALVANKKPQNKTEALVISMINQMPTSNKKKYDGSMDGEIYGETISDQNANHSISLLGDFWEAYWANEDYCTRWVTKPEKVQDTFPARELLADMAKAVYENAEPGSHNNDWINIWNPVKSKGRINTSNPCSEFFHLNNTSCNLSSFNVYRFLTEDGQIRVDLLRQGTRLAMIAADLNIQECGFPISEIATGTYSYRMTGIGFGNVGGTLMALGIPYDSDEGRYIAGLLTSHLTAYCWETSAEMGEKLGSYHEFPSTKDDLAGVIRLHKACHNMLRALPHKDRPGAKQAANKIAASHPNLPVWDNLNGEKVLIALSESFVLKGWADARLKFMQSLEQSDPWEKVPAEGIYRNSFVSLFAPGGCLVENSMVLTDKGLRRIKRLGNPDGSQWQPVDFQVQTDEGPKDATKFYLNGREETRIVRTTRLQEMQGTAKHQLKRLNLETLEMEWATLKEAQPGQFVGLKLGGMFGDTQTVWLPKLPALHGNNKTGVFVPETMNENLSEFLGLFMGDGSLHSKSVRICCANEDPDVIQYVAKLGEKLFGIKADINDKEGECVSVDFVSTPLANWFAAAGFQKNPNLEGGVSKKPFIPDAVLETNDPYTYGAFLRGLAEADGTLKRNSLPTIATHHMPFGQEIMTLMLTLGIAPSMDDSCKSEKSGKTLYRVFLRNHDYLPAWKKFCGFIGERKMGRQNNQKDRSFSRNDIIPCDPLWLHKAKVETRRNTALACALRKGRITKASALKIIAIEKNSQLGKKLNALMDYVFDPIAENISGGIQSTYDLSVPENVTYMANGFISHNTISAPLGIYDEGTTSGEPDYSLVKYKTLSGGGMITMFNSLALKGLKSMGYSEWHIREAALEVAGIAGLSVACGGSAIEAADHVTAPARDKVGPVRNKLNNMPLKPEETLVSFIEKIVAGKNPDADAMIANGIGNVENIPWMPAHHQEVFDCAATLGGGTRAIHHSGHIRMLGALMPFLSGAVSKTCNLPHTATVEDIIECFEMSHTMGVKCIALYRDGSKGVSVFAGDDTESKRFSAEHIFGEMCREVSNGVLTIQKDASKPRRNKLPGQREASVIKFDVGGQQDGFLVVGIYPDGTCGEVFGRLGQGGSFSHGMFESFCKAFSVMLQWGVPLPKAISSFKNTAFDPSGFSKVANGEADIKSCKSVVDLMMRILEWLFPEENGCRLRNRTGELFKSIDGEAEITSESSYYSEADDEPVKKKNLSAAEVCPSCGALALIQDGHCKVCQACGTTQGGCGG